MIADELSMGALNFYAPHAHAFDEVSRRVAATFATLGALFADLLDEAVQAPAR